MVATALKGESEDRSLDMSELGREGEQPQDSCIVERQDNESGDTQSDIKDVCGKEDARPSDYSDCKDPDTTNTEDPPCDSTKNSGYSSSNSARNDGDIAGGGTSHSESSSHGLLDEARCLESMPSSGSNKENVDHNSCSSLPYIEFDPSDYSVIGEKVADYDNTDSIPLQQLLKIHVKQMVSGFEFGEATKRRAQENMKSARDKKLNENRKSGEIQVSINPEKDENINEPCCSKMLSEIHHKTPHSYKRKRFGENITSLSSSDKDFCKATRRVPDCLLDHPDCIEVWVYMIYKEEAALKLRNPRLFNDFKSVTPRMRAILLDWLMEVAAVYYLRRVTYYLSVDYFDRFLSIRPDIPKSLLQLVGITCLYIAAKVEEIYPPNLSEFSYVCDGACKSAEMVSCELLILNSLGWEVVLTTPSDWLNLYMHLHFKSQEVVRTTLNMDFNKDFLFPQYSAYQFTRASQLMDLLSLDPGFLRFSYSVIAAAAMYFMYGEKIALSVSGLTWEQLKPCTDYMEVFYTIIKDAPDPRLYSCLGGPHPDDSNRPVVGLSNRRGGPQNENCSFQTHIASMEYFEKATIYRLSKLMPEKKELCKTLEDKSKVDQEGEVLNNPEEGGNADDLNSEDNAILDSLTKNDDANADLEASNEQNLMSLDEIFKLILSQEELKNSDE